MPSNAIHLVNLPSPANMTVSPSGPRRPRGRVPPDTIILPEPPPLVRALGALDPIARAGALRAMLMVETGGIDPLEPGEDGLPIYLSTPLDPRLWGPIWEWEFSLLFGGSLEETLGLLMLPADTQRRVQEVGTGEVDRDFSLRVAVFEALASAGIIRLNVDRREAINKYGETIKCTSIYWDLLRRRPARSLPAPPPPAEGDLAHEHECPVLLRGDGVPPLVQVRDPGGLLRWRRKPALGPVYAAVEVLVRAWPDRVKRPMLERPRKAGGAGSGARRSLSRLRDRDPDWAQVIDLGGVAYRGYGLITPGAAPTSDHKFPLATTRNPGFGDVRLMGLASQRGGRRDV